MFYPYQIEATRKGFPSRSVITIKTKKKEKSGENAKKSLFTMRKNVDTGQEDERSCGWQLVRRFKELHAVVCLETEIKVEGSGKYGVKYIHVNTFIGCFNYQ